MYCRALEQKLKSKEDLENILKDFTEKKLKSEIISFVNPFSYKLLSSNLDVITNVDHWFCDGSLLCALSNLKRNKNNKINRASFDFSSIASLVLELACKEHYKIILLGGTESEVTQAKENLKIKYNSLQIGLTINGFFEDYNFQNIIENINSYQPDIIIVGMGTPRQEIVSQMIKSKMTKSTLIFTCGGFITQTSIKLDFYNKWSKRKFRWLQRAIMFKHVRRRLIMDYPIFVISYLLDLIQISFREQKNSF